MSDRRIVLTGCHGLLGQRIVKRIRENRQILGIDIDEKSLIHGEKFQYESVDITHHSSIHAVIADYKPSIIIHTAAMTNVDQCESEREKCWNLNVTAVENLIEISQRIKSKFIHLSTDYIFDGKKKLCSEDDLPSPLNYYGRSKLASENLLRASGLDWAIIRTSTLFDLDILKSRNNFVTWVLQSLQNSDRIRIVDDQWGNPTLARNLASAIWQIIELEKSGIYHVAGKNVQNRFAFTKDIVNLFNLNMDLVDKIKTVDLMQAAQRPLQVGLDTEKTESELEMSFLSTIDALNILKHDYHALVKYN